MVSIYAESMQKQPFQLQRIVIVKQEPIINNPAHWAEKASYADKNNNPILNSMERLWPLDTQFECIVFLKMWTASVNYNPYDNRGARRQFVGR